MRSFPIADPGVPDSRGPLRYLWWLARNQAGPLLIGITFAIVWWIAQALIPGVIGKGIDSLTARDTGALVRWSLVLFALGALQAFTSVMRHRNAVQCWLAAAYQTIQVITRHATRLGATLPRRLSTGEVVSVGNSDITSIGTRATSIEWRSPISFSAYSSS